MDEKGFIRHLVAQPIDPSLRGEDEVLPKNAARMILRLKDFADRARAGELVDLALIATTTDGCVLHATSPAIGGRVRMLGALEMVKLDWYRDYMRNGEEEG